MSTSKTEEVLSALLAMMFFDPPEDLAKRLLDGQYSTWGHAGLGADGLKPRHLTLSAPYEGGGNVEVKLGRIEQSVNNLNALQSLHLMDVLNDAHPITSYLSLLLGTGQAIGEVTMLVERMNAETANLEDKR